MPGSLWRPFQGRIGHEALDGPVLDQLDLDLAPKRVLVLPPRYRPLVTGIAISSHIPVIDEPLG